MGGETTTTTTACGDLPLPLLHEDFLIKILVYLPVTSLLRFKSVCKSWLSLIQSSFFIHLHTTTTSTSKFGTFILQTAEPSVDEYGDDIKLFMLSSGSGDAEDDDNENEDEEEDDQKQKKMVIKVDDLGFLPFYKDFLLKDGLRMVGSCHGIICLHDPESMDESRGCTRHHYLNLRDVSLWNPATRQFRILPKSIPIEEKKLYLSNGLEDYVAFGFDVKTKDYKVLRITRWDWDYYTKEGGCKCRVQLYSLSTDSWRILEGINSLPVVPMQDQYRNHGIYLNGCHFFLKSKSLLGIQDNLMLLSFDFTKEIFTTMPLPDNNNSSVVVSSYLGEKLAVFTFGLDDCDDYDSEDSTGYDGYEYYDIWVLNEQHNNNVVVTKKSWTKLHSFQTKSRGDPFSEPRCISNNGEFAIISTRTEDWSKKLESFNLVTKEAKTDFLIGHRSTRVCRADVYKESLVSIMGGENENENGNVLLRWQLPTHGTTYKLNLDAPFIASNFSFGIGLCLTSDTGGGCIGVRSLKRYVRDATEGEALAILEAIKWVQMLELSPIIIESDSKNCVSFFMDDNDDDNNSTYWSSEAFTLLRDAKLLLNSSEISISFQYCSSRSCNYVADVAAKLGRESFWSCKDWTANSPGEMVRSLSKDLGLERKKVCAPEVDLGLVSEEGWAYESDLGLKTEKGWASEGDLDLKTEEGWASEGYLGLKSEKGWASEGDLRL